MQRDCEWQRKWENETCNKRKHGWSQESKMKVVQDDARKIDEYNDVGPHRPNFAFIQKRKRSH